MHRLTYLTTSILLIVSNTPFNDNEKGNKIHWKTEISERPFFLAGNVTYVAWEVQRCIPTFKIVEGNL